MEKIDKRVVSPIAMFVYNRVGTARKTIANLLKNDMACDTDLFVFSDGGRDGKSWAKVNEVRKYFHTLKRQEEHRGFKSITLVERPVNYYLERNVMEGIRQVFEGYDRVIVMEDDVITSAFFLKYMNDALTYYNDCHRVMHVAAFTPLDIPQKGDVYFTPHMSGAGGWATWKDRWENYFVYYKSREEALAGMTEEKIDHIQYGGVFHCLQSLDRKPIPWDICWEIAIYKNDGLCLSPTHALFRNIGLNNGTHFNIINRLFGHFEFDRPYCNRQLNVAKSPVAEDAEIETVLNPAALVDHGFRYNLFGKVIRYFYLKYFKKWKS